MQRCARAATPTIGQGADLAVDAGALTGLLPALTGPTQVTMQLHMPDSLQPGLPTGLLQTGMQYAAPQQQQAQQPGQSTQSQSQSQSQAQRKDHHPSLSRNQACRTCRSRKVRCDAQKPGCGACRKTATVQGRNPDEVVCEYDMDEPVSRKRKSTGSAVQGAAAANGDGSAGGFNGAAAFDEPAYFADMLDDRGVKKLATSSNRKVADLEKTIAVLQDKLQQSHGHSQGIPFAPGGSGANSPPLSSTATLGNIDWSSVAPAVLAATAANGGGTSSSPALPMSAFARQYQDPQTFLPDLAAAAAAAAAVGHYPGPSSASAPGADLFTASLGYPVHTQPHHPNPSMTQDGLSQTLNRGPAISEERTAPSDSPHGVHTAGSATSTGNPSNAFGQPRMPLGEDLTHIQQMPPHANAAGLYQPNGNGTGNPNGSAGPHSVLEEGDFYGLFWPNWPPSLPNPKLVYNLCDVYFSKRCTMEDLVSKPRFFANLALQPSHKDFPHISLIHAMCAIATRFVPADGVPPPSIPVKTLKLT